MRDSLNRWLRLSPNSPPNPDIHAVVDPVLLPQASIEQLHAVLPSFPVPASLSLSLKRLGYLRGIELEAPHPPTRLSTMREARKEFRVVAAQWEPQTDSNIQTQQT